MKILILPSWFDSPSYPNKGIFFREEAIALSKSENNVVLIDVTSVGVKDYFAKSNFHILVEKTNENLTIIKYQTPSIGLYSFNRIYSYMSYIKLKYLIYKIKLDMDFDIIHAHSILPGAYLAQKISKKYKIPFLVTEHSSGFLQQKVSKFELNQLEKYLNECSKFIAVSEYLKSSLVNLTNRKDNLLVIPNIVSDNFQYSLKEETEEFVFFSLGNLVESKNFDLLIKSFHAAFPLDNHNVLLKIGGSGKEYARLEKLILDLKEESRIILLGSLNRYEVINELKESDSFVLLSKYETFGIVYIEALAIGRPIIGTRNGGAEEIINSRNGYLIDTFEIEDVSNTLRKMITNYSVFSHKQISEDCLNRYGYQSHNAKLIELYESAIQDYKEKAYFKK